MTNIFRTTSALSRFIPTQAVDTYQELFVLDSKEFEQ